MNAEQLFTAYCDIVAHGNEHDDYERVAESLGLDPDDIAPLFAKLAATIEVDLGQSVYWPPESQVDRASGLSVAFRLGVLTALRAVTTERKDVPYA